MSFEDRLQMLRVEADQRRRDADATRARIDGVEDHSTHEGGDAEAHDPYARIKTHIHKAIIEQMADHLIGSGIDLRGDELTRDSVLRAINDQLDRGDEPLSRSERDQVTAEVLDEVLGYGPIDRYLRDDTVTEIMVNGAHDVWVERDGLLELTGTTFVDDEHVMRIIDKIVTAVGRRIDEASPMVDARLPDGSRVNAIIPPVAIRWPTLTIRKFKRDPMQMEDLIGFGTITPRAARFLELAVQGKANVLISGGTGSGKTTLLNVLSAAIPDRERIVTIEDAAELQLHQRHLVPLESRPPNIEGRGTVSIRDLVRNSLRMRPDRIIVGEVRGVEAVDMLQAMNTGHDGSMTTIHSNNSRDALNRLETLVMTSDVDLPSRAVRERIAGAMHLVVHIARLADGTRRIIDIAEVGRLESGVVVLQSLFVAEPADPHAGTGTLDTRLQLFGPLRCTGIVPGFLPHLASNGVKLPDNLIARE